MRIGNAISQIVELMGNYRRWLGYHSPVNHNQPHVQLHETLPPSEWVVRFGEKIQPGGAVLDVACGSGRHANWFADRGHVVYAVDREPPAKLSPHVVFKQADIEVEPWPYERQVFAGVVVTNYLHRPLLTTLASSIANGGWLIYETFAVGNEQFGRPSRADFLLQPGELLEAVRGRLRVVAYEHGYVKLPKAAVVQRIAAQFLVD